MKKVCRVITCWSASSPEPHTLAKGATETAGLGVTDQGKGWGKQLRLRAGDLHGASVPRDGSGVSQLEGLLEVQESSKQKGGLLR